MLPPLRYFLGVTFYLSSFAHSARPGRKVEMLGRSREGHICFANKLPGLIFAPPQKTALWQLGAQPQIACFVLSWRAHNCFRLCICMDFGNNVCLYALCVLSALFTQVVRTYGSWHIHIKLGCEYIYRSLAWHSILGNHIYYIWSVFFLIDTEETTHLAIMCTMSLCNESLQRGYIHVHAYVCICVRI